MHPDEYQKFTGEVAIYAEQCEKIANGDPVEIARLLRLIYTTIGTADEGGEVIAKVKKLIRDKGGNIDTEFIEDVKKELGDVMWYVARVADELGIPLSDVIEANVMKLADRANRGVTGGSGDNR